MAHRVQNKGLGPITELNRECNFLSRCNHENIVSFKGICWEPPPADVRGVVLEACKVCGSASPTEGGALWRCVLLLFGLRYHNCPATIPPFNASRSALFSILP